MRRLTRTARNGAVWMALVLGSLGPGACRRTGPALLVAGDSWVRKDRELPPDLGLLRGRRLHLRGARGETLGLQLVRPGRNGERARLALPGRVAQVRWFAPRPVAVREPSTEMYGPSRGVGIYPDLLQPLEDPLVEHEQLFVDVEIRRDAAPGLYAGTLELGTERLDVELRVEPVTISLEDDPVVWVFYLPRALALAHQVPDDDDPAELAIERKYVELFRKHGALLATDASPARYAARRELSVGARFVPVHIDISSEASIATDVAFWLRELSGPRPTPFVIPVDEPSSDAERAAVVSAGRGIARHGGGRPRLLRAVTSGFREDLAEAVDVFISTGSEGDDPKAAARRGLRRWRYNGRPPVAGSMILDTEGVALRTRGWIAFRDDVELWYIWEGMYFTDRYNGGRATLGTPVWPLTFDERGGSRGGRDRGNGDGVLAHPGAMPTLRLKALRRGLQDRKLLLRLAACGGDNEARAIAARLVPAAGATARGRGAWPTDERPWEAARGEVLDALVRRCPDAR